MKTIEQLEVELLMLKQKITEQYAVVVDLKSARDDLLLKIQNAKQVGMASSGRMTAIERVANTITCTTSPSPIGSRVMTHWAMVTTHTTGMRPSGLSSSTQSTTQITQTMRTVSTSRLRLTAKSKPLGRAVCERVVPAALMRQTTRPWRV